MFRFVTIGSLAVCVAALLGGCSEDAEPIDETPSAFTLPASDAATSELGVAGWRVDFPDGAYRVTGLDANMNEAVAMRISQSDGSEGASQTIVMLKTAAGRFDRMFTTVDDLVGDLRDGIAANPQAARALELMAADVGKQLGAPRLNVASLRPLEGPLVSTPPTGKGLMFGNDSSKKACGEENLVRPSCTSIINQTNLDCMTTAQCNKSGKTACGGSENQCKKDQAYVRTLGCDIKCAPSPARAPGRTI